MHFILSISGLTRKLKKTKQTRKPSKQKKRPNNISIQNFSYKKNKVEGNKCIFFFPLSIFKLGLLEGVSSISYQPKYYPENIDSFPHNFCCPDPELISAKNKLPQQVTGMRQAWQEDTAV